ncbi:MAG: GtrA family protein [Myxococcota bacterium]|nr:GtrA family protein [Deltaproteobacteria bacterium]MDQ3338900.1 GtrA family protein [Myxococcota bacterium]
MLAAGFGGVVGSVFDVVTLLLLVKLTPTSIPLSAFLAAGVGAVVCFLMNKYIAFRDGTPVTFEQVVRFGLVAVATGILTAGGMKIVAVDLHVPVLIAKALCAALVFMAWTFPAQRRFVFKPLTA